MHAWPIASIPLTGRISSTTMFRRLPPPTTIDVAGCAGLVELMRRTDRYREQRSAGWKKTTLRG
jgi:hypothetical protein